VHLVTKVNVGLSMADRMESSTRFKEALNSIAAYFTSATDTEKPSKNLQFNVNNCWRATIPNYEKRISKHARTNEPNQALDIHSATDE